MTTMTETINLEGKDRRHQTMKLIQELLEERKQVWTLYCGVAGLEPFRPDHPLDQTLQEFCQILMDYVSLGHFGIYQRLSDGSERRRKVLAVAEEIYPRIMQATDVAVNFNDKYENLQGETVLMDLSGDLSKLGEELATRIELEDRLIETMVA